jgi:acyl-CoA synthetase (AMP-forming)/AMP-acid ligase II
VTDAGHGAGVDLLALLEQAAGGHGAVRFLPDAPAPVPYRELWRRSGPAAAWLGGHLGPGGCVAALLSASAESLASLVGAWRAGCRVASLPLPARTASAREYGRVLDACCAAADARLLLVEDRYRDRVPPLRVPVVTYAECAGGGPVPARGCGELVQFTSGSTGTPKGVRLALPAVAANVLGILEVLAPGPDDSACSWLPLSHDMGLIGVTLAAWAAAGAQPGRAGLCLIRTEAFTADPGLWLRTCAELGVRYTAASTFGYALAARVLRRAGRLDLSALRACVVGAEPVRAEVLRAFADAAARAGLRRDALCPAYGLAEATVAVTMHRPGAPWSALRLDARALAAGRAVPAAGGAPVRELVSCGSPLPGVEVRVEGAPGPIAVRGPSLLAGYLPPPPAAPLTDGWLVTGDDGLVSGGQVHVVGRRDDAVVVRGRTIPAADLDAVVAQHPAVRAGCAAATGDGGYALVVELRHAPDGYRAVARDLDDRLVRQLGAGPARVVVVAPGSLPRTPSGKLARHRVQSLLYGDDLASVGVVEIRPPAGSTP